MISLSALAVTALYGAGLVVLTPYWSRFGPGEVWAFVVSWTLACALAYYAAIGGTLYGIPLWLNAHFAVLHPELSP